jgi:glutathione S-transferase
MITLHHLENSRSQRVLWLLEELGLSHGTHYSLKHYKRDPKTKLAPPELQAVHPLGKSPVLTEVGTGGKVVVAESGAIVEYLLDTHGTKSSLRPAAGTEAQRRFTYWLHFAEGSAMPLLLLKLVFDKVRHAPVPFFVKPVVKGVAAQVDKSFTDPNLARQFAYIEAELASRPWFAGPDFSAADIQMSYPVEAAFAGGGAGPAHPAMRAWLDKVQARPAYKRALDVGGPYDVMP